MVRCLTGFYIMFSHLDCSVLADESAAQSGEMYIRSVCFSPDGKFLATGAEDKRIRVRNFCNVLHEILLIG
jgi:WD40 repeat protein